MPSNSKSAILTTRCSHRTAAGRQCRSLSRDADSDLCPNHLAAQQQTNPADIRSQLIVDWKDFQTAQGINFSLGSLYNLLAANQISSRRAAVLAYISSLMLRTHAAIDSDRENGIDTFDSSADAIPPVADPTRETLGEQTALRAFSNPEPTDTPVGPPVTAASTNVSAPAGPVAPPLSAPHQPPQKADTTSTPTPATPAVGLSSSRNTDHETRFTQHDPLASSSPEASAPARPQPPNTGTFAQPATPQPPAAPQSPAAPPRSHNPHRSANDPCALHFDSTCRLYIDGKPIDSRPT